MKLITKSIERQLNNYPLYSQEEAEDKTIICKFFNPCGAQTWYIAEAEKLPNGDYHFFGYVTGMQVDEWGYFTLKELEAIRLPFGLSIERDIYFDPCKLSEIIN